MDWKAGLFGAVRIGVPGESWPIENDLPMIGLFQVRIDELPWWPDTLQSIAYLRAWCAEERWPRFPGELQSAFLTLAMSGDEEALIKFADEHKASMTIERGLDFDRIVIRPVTAGSGVVPLRTPDPNPLLNPARMTASMDKDYPGTADHLPVEFMDADERQRVQKLLGDRDFNESLWEEVERSAQNLYKPKVGGWPSPVQGQPIFGPDTEFVLQITGIPESAIEILDNGVIHIFRNIATGDWGADWTCH